MVRERKITNKIVLHACCGICSGYPISYLKDLGYEVCVYFYNPNIYPESEYQKRLEAERKLCKYMDVVLYEGEYNQNEYFDYVKGYEDEPEKGERCDKCFELRLKKTAEFAKSAGIDTFTTSIVISPHKDYEKISNIGDEISKKTGIKYLSVNFRKNDGFLKTNKISKELNLYRQNYCGCKFAQKM